MPLYEGPILDAHHHTIWDVKNNYPWMNGPMNPMIFGDDWSPMKNEYSIENLIDEYDGHNLSQSVHVQANFDISRTSDETRGLQGFADKFGFPNGIVAHADLTDPNLENVIESHIQYANTRGIRQQVYWHPSNTNWRFVENPDFCLSNAFRRGLSVVGEKGLTFDWQGFTNQFGLLADLAKTHSGVRFCLVHAGMLTSTETSIVNEWSEELKKLKPFENIFIKVSGLNTFTRQLSEPIMKQATDTALDMFGADRCFFGSNFPVERMWTTVNEYVSTQKHIMAGRSDAENEKFFHNTGKEFYQI